MSSRQRAEAIEKTSGCPRCTSWSHKKEHCSTQAIDCKELINGVRCHKDHSRLVCNSGIAYCLSTKTDSLERSDGLMIESRNCGVHMVWSEL